VKSSGQHSDPAGSARRSAAAAAAAAASAAASAATPPVDRNDLGFGSVVARQSRDRLLNRDGSFNVRREGLGFFQSLSLYHSLLNMSWPRFLLVLTGGFLCVNLVFACIYFAAGPDALSGLHWTTTGSHFLGCFFFSVQTFATIGYGSIAPAKLAANVLVVVEAVTGMLLVALGTGISFARFARPRARILFSDQAIIAPYRSPAGGTTAFEFRIANARQNQLTDVSARVLLARRRSGGDREFLPLKLERESVLFFPLSWTIVHPIDPGSPLFGQTAEDLLAAKAEFLILLSGNDETFNQVVHARSSYEAADLVWNARFQSLYNPPDEDGGISIDVGHLSYLERL
jgi:inward rectifier potassium channel